MTFLESASSNPFRNIEKSSDDFISNTVFAPHSITLQSQQFYTTMQRMGRFSITTEMPRPSCLLQQSSSICQAGNTTGAAAAAAPAEASLDSTPSGDSNSSMSSGINSYLDGMSDGLTSDINSICSSPISISSSADTRAISAVLSPLDTPARSPLSSPHSSLHSVPAFKPLAPAAVQVDSLPMGSVVQIASSGRFTVTTTSPVTPSEPLTLDPAHLSNSAAAAGAAGAAAASDLASVLITASSLTKKCTVVMFVSTATVATGASAADAAGSGTIGSARRYRPMPTVHHPVTYKAGRFNVTEAVLFGPHWPNPEQPLKQMAAAAAAAAARRLAERDSSRQSVSCDLDAKQAAATAAGASAAAPEAAATEPTPVVPAAGVQQSDAVTAEVIIAGGNQAPGGKGKGLAWVRKVFGKHGSAAASSGPCKTAALPQVTASPEQYSIKAARSNISSSARSTASSTASNTASLGSKLHKALGNGNKSGQFKTQTVLEHRYCKM